MDLNLENTMRVLEIGFQMKFLEELIQKEELWGKFSEKLDKNMELIFDVDSQMKK